MKNYDLAEEKQKLRSMTKQKRDGLLPKERKIFSDKICSILLRQPWFLQAETVYFYYPLGSETDLLLLAEAALKLGKRTAFPRVHADEMEFYQVSDLEAFCPGAFHVMEPTGERKISDDSALVLVPGLVFDRQGGRMGYGKGYYDKYFERYPQCNKIGICYGMQLISEVPCDRQDVFMDAVATEKGCFIISGSRLLQ